MDYIVIDMRSISCPEPLIRTIKVIDSLQKGGLLKVLTDKDECVKLIKEVIEGFNLGTIEVILEGGDHYALIIKIPTNLKNT